MRKYTFEKKKRLIFQRAETNVFFAKPVARYDVSNLCPNLT